MNVKKYEDKIEIEGNYSALEVEVIENGFGIAIDYAGSWIELNNSEAKAVADFIYEKLKL